MFPLGIMPSKRDLFESKGVKNTNFLFVLLKVLFERHYVIQVEDHPSIYNIKEIVCAFTFNIHRKEVSQKRVRKVKQSNGTFKDMQEVEVLFEKTDEDLVIVVIALASLTQATAHNITVLNENILELELENIKLKDELINLQEEMKKRRKVDDNLVPLKENIMEQQ
jgi:hypothetical protein